MNESAGESDSRQKLFLLCPVLYNVNSVCGTLPLLVGWMTLLLLVMFEDWKWKGTKSRFYSESRSVLRELSQLFLHQSVSDLLSVEK